MEIRHICKLYAFTIIDLIMSLRRINSFIDWINLFTVGNIHGVDALM